MAICEASAPFLFDFFTFPSHPKGASVVIMEKEETAMKTLLKNMAKGLLSAMVVGLSSLAMVAQNSLPAPGSGGSFRPNIGSFGGPGPGFGGFNPGPPPPSSWGNPWSSGWGYGPTVIVSPTITPSVANQGITKVVACGYDTMGVWRVIPLLVSYQYNGVEYVVNVLNAWNPWSDRWDRGVDTPAYSTDYYLRGTEYDYYTVLPTGTFYFNL